MVGTDRPLGPPILTPAAPVRGVFPSGFPFAGHRLWWSIANKLQLTRTAGSPGLAARWLAFLCVGLLVVAGLLSSNESWHAALHAASGAAESSAHHETAPDGASNCLLCAMAHQQVLGGFAPAIEIPVPVGRQSSGVVPLQGLLRYCRWESPWNGARFKLA